MARVVSLDCGHNCEMRWQTTNKNISVVTPDEQSAEVAKNKQLRGRKEIIEHLDAMEPLDVP